MESPLSRRHEVLSLAWEGVGLYAIAEGQVDRLLGTYTAHIPEPLRSVLLKSRRSMEERHKGLGLFLGDRQLAHHYPDLCSLFLSVGKVRHRLAHGNLIYIEPDEPDVDVTDPAEVIREGLGIIGNAGTGHISSDELQEFRDSAERLVGLLNMLIHETGAGGDAPELSRYAGMASKVVRVELASPREPMGYPRSPN